MRRLLPLFLALSILVIAQTKLDDLLKKVESNAPAKPGDLGAGLSNDKIISGLKEALSTGASKAAAATGKPDGYLKNDNIKITLPQKLSPVEKGMRLLGQGAQVDSLVVAMNRAAEQAAPKAKQIFVSAITKMSIDDARNILNGSDTAATEYFKRATSQDLTVAFSPIVHDTMQQVGVVQKYNALMQQAASIPMLKKEQFDLDGYVVQKSLDGLFFMLGEEEKKIRKNPAAQVTPLLKQVFGKK